MSTSVEKELKLLFAGDLVVYEELKQNPFTNSSDLKALFKEYDYRIVNFEAPVILPSYLPATKIGPSLYQKKGWEYFFSEDTFNVASLANNHIMDFGKEGLAHTFHELQKLNVPTVGAALGAQKVYEPFIIDKDGISIALFSANESTFGVFEDRISTYGVTKLCSPYLKAAIKNYRKQVNFIILVSHCGLEMVEYPLPEWRMIFREFLEIGVDIIINSHPHVIQGKELVNQKFIYYSLGNFFFNQPGKDPGWYNSLLVGVVFSKDGKIKTQEYFVQVTPKSIALIPESTLIKQFQENSLLLCEENEESYYNLIDAICLDYWHKYLHKYFSFQPFKEKYYPVPTFLQKWLNAIRYLFFSKNYFTQQNTLWLYHNLCIESNLFTINRALKLMLNLKSMN
ncbi:MAG: CapA family protein [Bacteroidia bacterium]|nr:CapA family protein [Bacteroidia bacterium]MDW8158549.1 CapA family protein [Bacteroidia bacterium]